MSRITNSMRTKVAAVLSAMLMTLPVSANAAVQRFWDVPSDYWAFEYIADLAERGVITGYDDGSFQPERTVSRAEWAKIMVDAAGMSVGDNSVNFSDMSQTHWANPYVNAAKQYMTGYTDGTFRPNQAATREDVTVALVLLKGYNTSDVDYSYLSFTDNNTISNYAKAYVAVAVRYDLISGFSDGSFRGQDTLSRAQAATLLYRAFQHGNADKVIGGALQPFRATPAPSKNTEYQQQATLPKQSAATVAPRIEPVSAPINEEADSADYTLSNLVSVSSVNSVYDYTSDNDGNIYYVDDEYIDCVNILSGKVEHFQYIPDLDFEHEFEDGYYQMSGFQVQSLCWDVSDNQLIIQGSFANVRCPDPENFVNSCIIKSPGMEGSLTLVTAGFDNFNNPTWADTGVSRITSTTRDGNMITNYQIINSSATELIDEIVPESEHWVTAHIYTRHSRQVGNRLYYVSADDANSGTHSVYAYDYSKVSKLLDFTASAYTITDSSLFIMTGDAFERQNFSGKVLGGVLFSDISISDDRPIKPDTVLEKLVVYNNCVVFYDTAASAFRKVQQI